MTTPSASRVLFNTANLVARFSGYKLNVAEWGVHEKKSIEMTDVTEFKRICAEIQGAGFTGVELWIAHCHPSRVSIEEAKTRRKIAEDHGLKLEALACAYTEPYLRIGEALGVKMLNGGFWGTDLQPVRELLKTSKIGYNYENHPEKTPEEILAKINNGAGGIGVALDTGWIGTAGTVDAKTFIDKLFPLLRHVHLKDVSTQGGHSTCRLGDGAVNIESVLHELKSRGYTGFYSWEDEPEDRNPMTIAAEMREYITRRI